jgi:hypothetical protein
MATGFTEPLIHSAKSQNYKYRSGCGMFSSAEWVHLFYDFTLAEEATEDQVGWTSIIDTGATIVDGVEHGGVIDVTSDAVDEGVALYLPQSVQLAGKKFFMEARVKLEDADDNQAVIGLSDLTSTTNPEDLWTTQPDFIAFGNFTDGDATPQLRYDKNNGGPVTHTPTGTSFDLTDGAYHILAISYNGGTTPADSSLQAWVDGKLAVSATTEAQIPEDLALAPFFGLRLEDDATDVMSIDWFRFAVER